jgi:hypothetical protein
MSGHADCIQLLHALGADVNSCSFDSEAPMDVALKLGYVPSIQLLVQLGAGVEGLLDNVEDEVEDEDQDGRAEIVKIVKEIRRFLAATALDTSPHQCTLFSVAQLATHYLQRHGYNQKQDVVDDFALRFAVETQDRLVVAPFEDAHYTDTSTPTKRKLVLFAARTAIDAAVAHAATEAKPIDAKVVAEVMNLLMSRGRVRDLHSLRLVCELTMRGSFPMPSYPFLELPTSTVWETRCVFCV